MTSPEFFLDGKVILHAGDCLNVMASLDPNSIDACVCDPPYGLGFMGKAWDHGVPGIPYWQAVFRVLKPGAHLVAFGGTRTFGRMHVAIEDAGFEIRDMISWLYGSGFPKSLDVSKAIDKAAGAKREVVRERYTVKRINPGATVVSNGEWGKQDVAYTATDTAPATEDAARWQGFGTALKPACEPICLARKPLIGTVAENVLQHGTGALNIDGCRVDGIGNRTFDRTAGDRLRDQYRTGTVERGSGRRTALGRWPANVIHDGSDEVVGAFPNAPGQQGALTGNEPSPTFSGSHIYGSMARTEASMPRGDTGSAARFFYTAKADANDRIGSKHPTVKPLDLMQWLVRLVTPPCGLVLDPFSGTGTTGEAAFREGFRAILIEREPEYQNDIRRRMALCMSGPEERKREGLKARNADKPVDHGPLFSGSDTPPRRGRQIYGVFADEPSGRRD